MKANLFTVTMLWCGVVAADIIPPSRLPGPLPAPWQYAGVPGGIPSRATVFANVRNAPYNAIGDGSHDDTSAFTTAIASCPSNQVVYVPSGVYRTTSTINLLTGRTLRGNGWGNTILKGDHAQASIINMGVDLNLDAWPSRTISSGANKSSTNVVLNSTASFRTGELILIDELNDPALTIITGSSGLFGRSGGARAIAHLARVENIVGTTVTFWPPLVWNYTNSFTPQACQWVDFPFTTSLAGVEDLTIWNSGGAAYDIQGQLSYGCWERNVEHTNTSSIATYVTKSACWQSQDCYYHDPALHTVNRGYGVEFGSQVSGALVQNSIFNHMAFCVSLMWGAHGCVIGYNFFTNSNSGTDSIIQDIMLNHGPFPMMNLVEGCPAAHISADITQGGNSAYTTLYRNWFNGWIAPPTRSTTDPSDNHGIAVELMATNFFYNVVGNVIGVSTHTPTAYQYDNVTANGNWANSAIYQLCYLNYGANSTVYPVSALQLYRHGNYDYFTHSTIWDGGNADHALPDSLYLTSKPAWFDTYGVTPLPTIGPDLIPFASDIPAQKRLSGILPGSQPGNRRRALLISAAGDAVPKSLLSTPELDGLLSTNFAVIFPALH